MDIDRIINLYFKKCVVPIKIGSSENTPVGTGFFIAPGIILTCFHLFNNYYHELSDSELQEEINRVCLEKSWISWEGRDYECKTDKIIYKAEERSFDAVFLSVVDESMFHTHPIAVLSNEKVALGSKHYIFGYPGGTYGDNVTLEYEGETSKNAGMYLLKFKLGQVQPGFSGSPILDTGTGAVCGYIKTSRDIDSDLGARGIPILLLMEEIGNYRKGLKNINPEWENALAVDDFEIRNYVKYIDRNRIESYQIADEDEIKKIAVDYYMVNDSDELVFKVVCNDIDVVNRKLLNYSLKRIERMEKSAVWVLGNGGTGKTTFLIRLAVTMAKNMKSCFWINFENLPMDCAESINKILEFVAGKTEEKAYLFIDNPDVNHAGLAYLISRVQNTDFNYVIVFAERENRYHLIKEDNIPYAVTHQEPAENIKVYNPEDHRRKVYSKLYELIGDSRQETWEIIHNIGIKERIAFVNATYKILYELGKQKIINYRFDWAEFEAIMTSRLSKAKTAYKYIALMYYYGVKINLDVLGRILGLDSHEKNVFIEILKSSASEPVIISERERDFFEKEYYLRTKHEVISELYFKEKNLNRDSIFADIIKNIDYACQQEVCGLMYIFGNKKNLKDDFVNLDRFISEMLKSNQLRNKLSQNAVIIQTLILARVWRLVLNDENGAVALLLEALKTYDSDLHFRMELAKICQRQGKLGEAEKYLLEIIDIHKVDLQSRTELAKIYQNQDRLEEAEKLLLEILSLDKENLHSRTELAKIYQRQDKLEEAEKLLLQITGTHKKDLHSRVELSKIYQRQGKLEEAEKLLLEIINFHNNDLQSRTELARIYQRKGRLEEAEKLLLENLRIDNKQLQSRTELARIYQRQGRLEEAEKYLLEYIKLEKNGLHPRTELAKIYQRQGRIDEAEEVLLESLKIDSKQLHPRTELAKIYQRQDKLEEAEKVLLDSLVIDHKQVHPRTELARIYQRQGKLEEAEKVLLKSLSINDKQLHPRTELAKIYQRQNRLEEAEKVLLESLKIDYKQLHPRTELAKIYQRQNRLEEAEKELLQILKLDKNNLQSRTELAKVYQRQGKLEEAEKYLLEYMGLYKNGLHPRTELAKVYQRQGKLEEAEKILLESLSINDKQLHPRTELAKIYQRQNRLDEAEAILSYPIKENNIFALAELINILSKSRSFDDAFEVFDKIMGTRPGKIGRDEQASFNNLLKMCEKNRLIAKGKYYYSKYYQDLDQRNRERFKNSFDA